MSYNQTQTSLPVQILPGSHPRAILNSDSMIFALVSFLWEYGLEKSQTELWHGTSRVPLWKQIPKSNSLLQETLWLHTRTGLLLKPYTVVVLQLLPTCKMTEILSWRTPTRNLCGRVSILLPTQCYRDKRCRVPKFSIPRREEIQTTHWENSCYKCKTMETWC